MGLHSTAQQPDPQTLLKSSRCTQKTPLYTKGLLAASTSSLPGAQMYLWSGFLLLLQVIQARLIDMVCSKLERPYIVVMFWRRETLSQRESERRRQNETREVQFSQIALTVSEKYPLQKQTYRPANRTDRTNFRCFVLKMRLCSSLFIHFILKFTEDKK